MRYMVIHSGKRDGYNVVKSFGSNGLLVTDFYPTGILKYVPKIKNRYDRKVNAVWSLSGLCCLLLLRLTNSQKYSVKRDKAVGRLALKYLLSDDFVIAYQGFAYYLPKGSYTLFVFHPYYKELRTLYRRYSKLGLTFKDELEIQLSEEIEYYSAEISGASSILVSSNYVEQTIRNWHAGVQINKVMYGVKPIRINKSNELRGNKIRLLFWGQYVERKGIQYLHQLDSSKFELNIIWRGRFDERYVVDWACYHNDLRWDEVIDVLESTDLMIMPSISEGFGQVALEALSAGIPVVGSQYSVLADLQFGVVSLEPEEVIHYVNAISESEINNLARDISNLSLPTWSNYQESIRALSK